MRGEIVGVKDGKVLIRPVPKAISVPITSLSKKDQEFIAQWEKDEAERAVAAKKVELERHMNTPLLKALSGNLQVLDDEGALTDYDIPSPGKLELVAVFFTARKVQGKPVPNPRGLDDLAKKYSRLLRRYPHFEMLLFPFDDRETDVMEFMAENKILFPTLRHSVVNTQQGQAVRASFTGRFPCLMLMERDGTVLVDSSKQNPPNLGAAWEEIEKIVKRRAPDDDEE